MRQNRKRLWALLLTAALIVTQLPAVAMAESFPTVKAPLGEVNTYAANNTLEEEGIKIAASDNGEVEYNVGSGFKLKASGTYEISGTWNGTLEAGSLAKNKAVITIPDGIIANVTLDTAAINVSSTRHACAFAVETNGTANITLSGTNTLESGNSRAGLEVQKGASVTIAGSGSLSAIGGDRGAGIGGSNGTYDQYEPDAGSITISGDANVTAQGGLGGAGLGGGYSGQGGTIIISSEADVRAQGGNYAAGIGGGAVGDGGTIIIRGGTVTAKGGGSDDSLGGGAGIGGGRAYGGKGHGGTITISGGSVSATGSARGAGIGGGGGAPAEVAGSGGHITISGGSVEAVGSKHGAGIGGGGGANAGINGGEAGTIEINGDTVVFATAPEKGAHIGSGGNFLNGGANSGSFTKGMVFEGQQGTVHGSPTLPGDVTIPQDHTLTVPDGSELTVPGGMTLSNNGTIENNGEISGGGSIKNNGTVNDHSGGIDVTVDGVGAVNKPSGVEITFMDSRSGQITQATYDDAIEIIATAQRKVPNTLAARGAALNQVDFYIGTIAPEHKLGTAEASTDSSTATAVLKITLTGEAWNKGFAIGENTIIADFGGADTLNLLGSIGTAKLNVKVPPTLSLEAAPAGAQTLPGTVTLSAILLDAYPDNAGKTITFTVNGSEHGTAVTDDSGVAAYSITNLPQGGYTFGASFAGDTLNPQATAAQISGYTVSLGTQAELSIKGLDSAYTYGCETFDLSTSGGSGSGAVSFVSSEPSIAGVAGNTVTIQKAGTFAITATKAADPYYAEAKVTSHVVTVHSATPNMSLTASGGSTTTDPLTLTATVSKVGTGAMPAGTVTFKVGEKTLHSGSLDSDGKAVHTISNPEAGSHTYTVEYSGQAGYYNGASTSRTIGVGLTDQTGFAIKDPGVKTYGDGDFTLTTSGGESTGGVSFSVRDGNGVLAVAADGSVKIIGAGQVMVTATKEADGKYNQAEATLELTVSPRDISNVTVNVVGSHVYTGSQLQPGFDVYDGSNAITTGDYTNSYGTNVAAGTGAGSIVLTGQRNYTGQKTVQFDIEKRSLDSALITLEASSYTHTGSEIKPAVTNVTVEGISVPADEYDVGYTDNKEVGTATVTITAKADGNFSGSASAQFTITKANTPSGGGGSRGNSSNGSTVTTQTPQPTAEDPNPPTIGKITPTVTVDQDGKVTVSVSDGDIQSAIDKATAQAKKDGTLANGIAVSIDLTGLKTQFHTLPLTLSRTVYQKLVDAGVKYMSIATPQISLLLDLETLKTISASAAGNVTISAVRAEDSRLPEGMQNRPAYDLTIVSGGKQISDFGKGNITVTLPYALKGTEQGGSLQLAYVDTEGKAQNMTNSGYRANQAAVIGRTNHFTVFGIALKPAPVFKDIEGHWAKDDILFVASREVLSGTGNNQFSPDTGMTRGMFVTALGRLAGIDPAQYKNTKFSDVAAAAYYAPYVAWAAEKGIVNGTADTTFAPDTNISREQMAVIMQNYAKTMGCTVPKTRAAATFADNSSIESWAKEAVKVMQMAGVMNGKNGNRFDPKASATRAEVSAVLRQFVEIVIDLASANS